MDAPKEETWGCPSGPSTCVTHVIAKRFGSELSAKSPESVSIPSSIIEQTWKSFSSFFDRTCNK